MNEEKTVRFSFFFFFDLYLLLILAKIILSIVAVKVCHILIRKKKDKENGSMEFFEICIHF